MTIHIDYCYRDTAETFGYIRIPKALISYEPYCNISADAKIAYGLMIERTSLSRINQWVDGQNRVYITYTIESLMAILHRSRNKIICILRELDTRNGCGLIERKRRGLGRPDIIYVRVIDIEVKKKDFRKSPVATSSDPSQQLTYVPISYPNYPNDNYPDNNYPDINPDMDPDYYTRLIHNNIDYITLIDTHAPEEVLQIDQMVETIVQAICSNADHIRINNVDIPISDVQQRLLQLDMYHIDYVLRHITAPSTPIHNISLYTLTALYNAVTDGGGDL